MDGTLFPDLTIAAERAPRHADVWRPRDWQFGALEPRAYDFIDVDVPWEYELYSENGEEKAPQSQYECLSIEELLEFRVTELAHSSTLFNFWSTWPMLAAGEAHRLLEGWRLTAITGGSWAKRTASGKLRWGPGYVIRSASEPWLLAVSDASVPFVLAKIEKSERHPSLVNHIDGLAREHSRKPDEFYSAIVAATPGKRRACLFSAGYERPGFECWGKSHRQQVPA